MAGILSYALSLETQDFRGPLMEATMAMQELVTEMGKSGEKTKEAGEKTKGYGEKTKEMVGELKKFMLEMAVLATGIEGVKEAWELFKGALEKGHELETLSQKTGATVKDLVILQQMFKACGASAGDVGPALGRMQTALGGVNEEGVVTKGAFEALGLDMEELTKMGAVEQFTAIGQAISHIGSAAQRAAAAKDIFGKLSGQAMLPMFLSPEMMDKSAKAVGEQAELLEENAAKFSEAAVYLNMGGLKLQGFFVGAASELVDVMLPALRSFGAMDYSGLGKQAGAIGADLIKAVGEVFGFFDSQVDFSFGEMLQSGLAKAKEISEAMLEGVRFFREAFNQGKLGELLGLELRIGLGEAVNFFSSGLKTAWGWMSTEIPNDFHNAVAILTDPAIKLFFSSLVTGLTEGLKSGFYSAASVLSKAIGESLADVAESAARWKIDHWGLQKVKDNPFTSFSDEQKERFKAKEIAVARSEVISHSRTFDKEAEESAKKAQDAFETSAAAMQNLGDNGVSTLIKESVGFFGKLGEFFTRGIADVDGMKVLLEKLKASVSAAAPKHAPGGEHGEGGAGESFDSGAWRPKAFGTYVNHPENASQEAADKKKAEKQASSLEDWGLETKLLEAKAGKNRKEIEDTKRAMDFKKTKEELKEKLGLDDKASGLEAERRLQLEDKVAGNKRKGVLDAAATEAKNLERQEKQDLKKDAHGNYLNPEAAAKALKKAEADPANQARKDAIDKAEKAANEQRDAAKKLQGDVSGIFHILQKVDAA